MIMSSYEREEKEFDSDEEPRFQLFFENAPLYCYFVSPKGIILDLNKAAVEVLGYKRVELIGKHIRTIYAPECEAKVNELFDQWKDKGTIHDEELIIQNKSGERRIVLLSANAIRDTEGSIKYSISIQKDITEKKLAEINLKKSEERFRSLVEDTAGWVWEINSEYRFVYSNSSVEDILGYTAGQIIGRSFLEYLDPITIEEAEAIFTETFNRQKPFKTVVNSFHHRDGYTVILEASGRPIFKENGQLEGFRGVCRDITQRIDADQVLRESEARYRSLVETSPDSITLTDLNGIIEFVNDRSVKLLGFNTPEELLGKNCFDFIIPEERNHAIETLNNTKAHGSSIPVPFSIIHRDGTIFPAEISASLLIGADGRPTGYIIVTRNITERKASEQALQEAKARSEFFTDLMAHDLNNINQAILSALELQLLNPNLPEELKEQLQLSLDQVERSAALIGRVKKFSGMDDVETKLEIRDIEPDFQSALQAVKNAFPDKTVLLDTNIYPDEYKVLADDLLVDLFFNILHNAVKFDQKSKIEIEARVYADTNKRYLRVEISDHGLGIPDDLKRRIFARYTQRVGEKAQGSGIGLTLVQRIVDRYGGRIWVEDRVNGDHTKGAKIIFLLPIWN